MLQVLIVFHVATAFVSITSGSLSLFASKGRLWHRRTGAVFFVAMLGMGASGALLAVLKTQMGNTVMGIFVVYLTTTGWLTVRRPAGTTGMIDSVALAGAGVLACGSFWLGWQISHGRSVTTDFTPAGFFFFVSGLAMLAAMLDMWVLRRGGVRGAGRIARHLWRMCFPLLIAVASLFIGRANLFPKAVRHSGVLYVPVLIVLLVSLFWLLRVLFTKLYRQARMPSPSRQLPA